MDAADCVRVLESAVRACERFRSGGLDDYENEDVSAWLDAHQIVGLIADLCCSKLAAPCEGGGCIWAGAVRIQQAMLAAANF